MRVISFIGIGFTALHLLSVSSVYALEIVRPADATYNNVVKGLALQTARRKTPVVTWTAPLPITIGVALGPTQLNATANVPGTFVYLPVSGTVLQVGANQTLSVNFTPTDNINYRSVNNTHVRITVNPNDNPVIAWANPADITYGIPLGSVQLNATADMPGTFIYNPPAGTILLAGANQVLTSDFTPTDTNYNLVITTVAINVNTESNNPLNQPPILTNIESGLLLYDLGDTPIPISNELIVSDVDDSFMSSARITLMENYKKGDLLTWVRTVGSAIIPAFNAEKGELLLTGKDSKSNYETALHHILFSRPISGDTAQSVRIVAIAVKDSSAESNLATRVIRITNAFPELSIVNAFTPNSDKVNDNWDFVNLQFYKEINISVVDQNGIRVFDCSDKACLWDGKNKGNELPAGPYFYTINLDRGKRTYHGTVTLLK